MTVDSPSGTPGRTVVTGLGCRVRCQVSFWCTVPSPNGAWPDSMK